MKKQSLTVLTGLVVLAAACGAAAEPPLKALIVTGQNNHGWQTSSPIIKRILEQTGLFTARIMQSPSRQSGGIAGLKPDFAACDVVVLDYNGELWCEKARNDFVEYVKNGGGVVVYHAADNAFSDWPQYNRIIGLGGWGGRNEKSGPYVYFKDGKIVRDSSPGRGGGHGKPHDYQVVVREPDHPITKGLPVKWMHAQDELYDKLRGPAEELTVLATAYSDPASGGTGRHEPVLFTVGYGKGRVFHTVLGHAKSPPVTAMQCVGFITTFQRGTEWAATGRVTQPVPEDFPTAEEVRKWPLYRRLPPVEEILSKVARYDYGDSRLALTDLTDLIRSRSGSAEELQAIEQKLIGLLQSGATSAAKQFACGKLSIIGTERSVPVLSAMLVDESTSDMARYALERIPGCAVDEALRAALPKSKGAVRIGIINSIGQRADSGAVKQLDTLLLDQDSSVAAAAAAALGKIGGDSAREALAASSQKVDAAARPAVLDSYLACADEMAAAGDTENALAIYEELYRPAMPTPVRAASLRGILIYSGDRAGRIIIDTLKSDDAAMHAIAVGLLDEVGGQAVMETVTRDLTSLSPAGQSQVITALAARGDRSVLPAVVASCNSQDKQVRTAALEAIGTLGDACHVGILAETAAGGGQAAEAAAGALYRLSGEGVDQAILKTMLSSGSDVQVACIKSLAERRYEPAAAPLIEAAETSDSAVRRQSLKALETLAGEQQVGGLLKLLLAADSAADVRACERAVIAACGRVDDPQQRTGYILNALPSSAGRAKASLLGILGRYGGEEALGAVAAAAGDSDAEVSTAAVRALADWPNASPAPILLNLAKTTGSRAAGVLALRGYIRMADLVAGTSAGRSMAMYRRATELANRTDEKKLILAGLQKIHEPQALQFIEPYLGDSQLLREAEAAYATVAVAIREKHPDLAGEAFARIQKSGAPQIADVTAGSVAVLSPGDAALTPPMVLITDEAGVLHTVVPTEVDEVVPQGLGGRAVYRFRTTAAGRLSLEFRINCPGVNTNDSWYVTIDDRPFITWNDNDTVVWEWRPFPASFDLAAGEHTLTVDQREDGAKMAAIKLSLKAE
jgi:HEAT repeat protein/type 1 glutamine amidotransferase